MGATQPVSPLLLDWCRQLLGHQFRSPAYEKSRAAPGGETLIDELAFQLASELTIRFQQQGIVAPASAIMAAQRDAPEQRDLNTHTKTRARLIYLTRLHADLSDRPVLQADGSQSAPSPCHLEAQGELWLVAYDQLVQVRTYGEHSRTYRSAVAFFDQINYTEGDFRNDFWEKIWPAILDGRHSAGHQPVDPAKPGEIPEWLFRRGRAFLTHKVRELYRQYREVIDFERSLGGNDDPTPEQEEALAELATTSSDAGKGLTTEPLVIGQFDEEALLRQVLQALVEASRANRLGFLIFLLMIDLRDLEDTRRGPAKKKQIAELLNRWSADRADLKRYLTDPKQGIGLGDDLATEIMEAVEPGFAAFTIPIIPIRVGELHAAFCAAMRAHLDRDWFDQ